MISDLHTRPIFEQSPEPDIRKGGAAATDAPPCRVFIVDDHKFARDSLVQLVNEVADFEVIGEAADVATAVDSIARKGPDVALVDIGMPGSNGIELARILLSRHKTLRIIAVSAHVDPVFVAAMLDAGALGYISKEVAFEELEVAVRSAMRGRPFLSSGLNKAVLDDYRRLSGAQSRLPDALTKREREVLGHLADGLRNRQVAELLGISVKTVETHRMRIMGKLELGSVAGLTKYALRHGLTSLD